MANDKFAEFPCCDHCFDSEGKPTNPFCINNPDRHTVPCNEEGCTF